MGEFRHELRQSIRSLGRAPLFTFGTILILALGMSGAITFFGAYHGAVLRRPPYPGAERLYQVILKEGARELPTVSAIPVREMAAACPSVESLGLYTPLWGTPSSLEADGKRERIPTAWVDAGLLSILGQPLALGGTFQDGHFATGDGVILTHRFWKERMGGDPSVVGRNLPLAGKSQQIVGVLNPDFELSFALGIQLLRPLPPLGPNKRGEFRFTALARLKEGARPGSVEEMFGAIHAEQARRFPANTVATHVPTLLPLRKALAGSADNGFLLVCGAALLLLLLSVTNVAALFLNRGAARIGETSVRLSLGASRWRILKLGFLDGLLVSLAAALLGTLFAIQAGGLLRAWLPGGEKLHGLGHAWAHPAMAAFVLFLVLAQGLVLGSLQAFQVRSLNLEGALRGEGPQARGTHRVRNGLVVAQLALASLLLFGSGLLGRSLQRVLREPLGIATTDLQVVDLELKTLASPPDHPDLSPLLQGLRTLPGIRGAALARCVPTDWSDDAEYLGFLSLQSGSDWTINASADPVALEASEAFVSYDFVSEGYAETLGLKVLRGRTFSAEDVRDGHRVCVLDKHAADRFFPGGALGRKFYVGIGTRTLEMAEPLEVVGVLSSFRTASAERAERPFVLLPSSFSPPMRIVLRSSLPPAPLRKEVAGALEAAFPQARVRKVESVDGHNWARTLPRRQVLALLTPFAGLALLMAALGLGALTGSQVAQRTRELGIRAALGATPARLLATVMGGAVRRTFLGILLGATGCLAASRALRSLLYQVEPSDPAALVGAAGIVLCTTFLAALAPAFRAARIPPAEALRNE